MHSDLGTNAAVEFCVTLKGKGKAQKVAAFESLATARMWTGGAGATAVAQGQQWIGRPVRKNFDGVVHEGLSLHSTQLRVCSRLSTQTVIRRTSNLMSSWKLLVLPTGQPIQLQFPADPPEHQVAWRCPIHTTIRHCGAAA